MIQVLLAYDINSDERRDAFREALEREDWKLVQKSLYSREFENEESVKEVSSQIKKLKESQFFGKYDDVRLFEINHHWYPVEREKIRFF